MVVGAGAAGLGVAGPLKWRGVGALALERAKVGSSQPHPAAPDLYFSTATASRPAADWRTCRRIARHIAGVRRRR